MSVWINLVILITNFISTYFFNLSYALYAPAFFILHMVIYISTEK